MPDPLPLPLSEWATAAMRPQGHAPAPHHRLLLDHLESVSEGRIDRLMVLMPPGSAKSTYGSVIFPAWWLARHPRHSIIAASHTSDLAEHFARRVRALATEGADQLGYTIAGRRAAADWTTEPGGAYFATGVRGPITGRRADLVLIDDPVKSHAEADSATLRDSLWNWYRSDLLTRLRPGGRIVLIMTRWHQDDLGGRVLENAADWTVLKLPALAEAGDALGRAPGDPLWPDWQDAANLARTRAAVGPRVWQASYQQDPRPDTGALFRIQRIATLDAAAAPPRVVRAWDLAATAEGDGRDPDWTVGLKLGREADGRFVVHDVVRLRGNPHEVEQAIRNTAAADGRLVPIGLPQDPGQAGKQQVAWLTTQLAGHRVVSSPETGSKLVRAGGVAGQVEAGNLGLVRAGWNRALLDELRDFPTGRKDDQVDALSRAFAMLTDLAPQARRMTMPFLAR